MTQIIDNEFKTKVMSDPQNDYIKVYSTPSPQTIPAYSPDITILNNGRLMTTLDRGGEMLHSPTPGLILISDDDGKNWTEVEEFPLIHARGFKTHEGIYIIGHRSNTGTGDTGEVGVLKSTDNGQTWSETIDLTSGESWHAAPTNILYHNNKVYMVMEKQKEFPKGEEWPVGWLAPVVLSAPLDKNLLEPENWTFSNDDIVLQDHFQNIDGLGMPFFPHGNNDLKNSKDLRWNAAIGWLEANIETIHDPDHIWFDPEDKTFIIVLRCHGGGMPNHACILKATEKEDGSIQTDWLRSPTGQRSVFISMPGGHLKFYITYDKKSQRYFMAANLSNDSMTRPELLSPMRTNLPDNERRHLGLFVSKNLIDWQFARIISSGEDALHVRNYPSMAIDDDDLIVVSRSGDDDCVDAHNSNIVSFHRIENFRNLIKPWH